MKSVCIIVYHLGVGGAEQTVVGEIKEFLKRGFRVHLVTLSPERPRSLIKFVPPECERELVEFRSPWDFSAHHVLARFLQKERPDIIITQMWFANTVGKIACKRAGLSERLLCFEQNVYDRLKLKTRKQFLVDRLLQGWCRKIAAASGAIGESLKRVGIGEKRIVVIHDAIDMQRIDEAKPVSIKRDLGIEGQFAYLFAGRLVHQKGVDVLLRAFAKTNSGALLIAGDGLERESLQKLAAELGITERVHFLGVRHDVPSIMKSVDCFVLASRLEGLGLVLVEAIVAGLPVIATKTDGIVEVVREGESGLLVPPEDVHALAGAMNAISADPRTCVSEQARERVRRLFSIETHVDKILACFA